VTATAHLYKRGLEEELKCLGSRHAPALRNAVPNDDCSLLQLLEHLMFRP
jgi:hypothetical protein